MTISEKFPHIAQTVKAHKSAEITGEVYVGENCNLAEQVKLHARGGRLVLGDDCHIGKNSYIWSESSRTIIGDEVSIGQNCEISGSIGDSSKIGDNVIITSSVTIGKNCTIQSNQKLSNLDIPDGSTVENGSII